MITENPLEFVENKPDNNVQVDINTVRGISGKKLLYFSDGVMEEDESDDNDQTDANNKLVDPKTLSWIPWFAHYASLGGSVALYYADYVGETLANLFGITTPKYQLEINEYERQEAAKKKLEEETAGWVSRDTNAVPMVTQPTSAGTVNEKPVPL